MKNLFKVLMVVGLLAIMLPLLFGVVLGPVGAGPTEIVKDHADSKTITNATCSGCHDANWLDPNDAQYPGAHIKHFTTNFLTFYGVVPTNNNADNGCGRCHIESVYGGGVGEGLGSGYEGDLSYASTDSADANFVRAANKSVKPDVCESCHGQFNSGTAGHASVTTNNTCVNSSCHQDSGTGGDAATEHAAAGVSTTSTTGYINTDYANSPTFCARCHGELAWFATTATSNTLEQ